MPLEVKQFNCPKCGSPLDLKNAGRSKSIICPSCNSQIDLTSPEYQVIGKVGDRPAPRATQFQVGMEGTLESQKFQIIGRVVYRDDEGDVWDEWLLLSAAGEYVWISDSVNEGMALWRGFVPPEPVEPDKVHEGDTITLRGEKIRVRDRGRATIDYLEGELTWKATVGSTMQYIEADSAKQRISIEFTENEVEFYAGGRMDGEEIAKAFGAAAIPQRENLFTADAGKAMAAAGPIMKGISIVMMLIFFGCIALMCVTVALISGGGSSVADTSLLCYTPVAVGTAIPGAPTPVPVCVTRTPAPRSSGGGGFFIPSSGGSTRSGSSGGRSTSGGGGSTGGGK